MESKIQCSSFLESVNRNRQQALGKEHVSTEQGALYPNNLVCLSKTIKFIHEVAARNDMKTLTEISAAYKPQPTQTVRNIKRSGFAPTVTLFQPVNLKGQ